MEGCGAALPYRDGYCDGRNGTSPLLVERGSQAAADSACFDSSLAALPPPGIPHPHPPSPAPAAPATLVATLNEKTKFIQCLRTISLNVAWRRWPLTVS
jgi:hypothetical protein